MIWEKKVPDKPGWWVRLNVVHQPQLHCVSAHPEFHDDKLRIYWGWGGEGGLVRLDNKQMRKKMATFWWTGPLPEFPNRET